MKSIWRQDVTFVSGKSLQNNMSVQAVVIGGGMAGMLTAYFLQKKGVETVVLEANHIASGQTENTTAKITSQHGLFYADACKMLGNKRTMEYAVANERAIEQYEEIVKKEKIECHFKRLPSYLYTRQEKNRKKLQGEAKAAERCGIKSSYTEGKKIHELPFPVAGAVRFENQAQFHPLAFMKALSEKVTVYENTKVLSVKGHTVVTEKNRIEADYIVFATHYPFINVPGFYFLRQHQERSYVLALRDVGELSGMYYGIDEDSLSFRSAGKTLLLGGGSHRTGKKNTGEEGYGYTFLKEKAKEYYSKADITTQWSAQDCMPHDGVPFIGSYSVFRPYWYVASGFKKWGMTTSMIAATIISNEIYEKVMEDSGQKVSEKDSHYEEAFSPQRLLLWASIKDFCTDLGESVAGLGKGLLAKPERRCPHLGCKTEWNPEENSWDCPCHGSRFTYEGELKDNPAQMDLKTFHNGV